MENGDYIVDFFLYKNNLIVQSNSFNGNYDSFTNIDIYSLSDIKNPKKIHSFKQQGSYVSSRQAHRLKFYHFHYGKYKYIFRHF